MRLQVHAGDARTATETTTSEDTCPDCSSRLRTERGETTCVDCGLVVAEYRIDHGPETRTFDDDPSAGDRTGAPLTNARHDRGLSTHIGRRTDARGNTLDGTTRRKFARLRRQHKRGRYSSKAERNPAKACSEIARMVAALHLPRDARETASTIYRRTQDQTIRERATAGSTVLTTASSLTGVHLAWLLARLAEEDELAIPVTLVGRTATLWKAFGYDEPSIETMSTFADPTDVLDASQVTIAGPEVPVAGSAEALFDHVDDDPGATLVQVTSGAFDPETGDRSRGTVYDFQVGSHPTEETIDEVVEALDPVHVVITHQQGSGADQYKDKYDSFVWVCDDADEYTLYDDEWVGPPWVTEATVRRIRARQYGNGGPTLGAELETSEVPLPTVERSDDPTLVDEGIDVNRLGGGSDSSRTPSEIVDSFDGGEQSNETESSDQSPSNISATDDDLLRKIDERVAQIEAAVVGQSVRARAVDAGDGVTLLRPIEGSLNEDLTRGEVVDVTLSK